jgi:hypothetical protein
MSQNQPDSIQLARSPDWREFENLFHPAFPDIGKTLIHPLKYPFIRTSG